MYLEPRLVRFPSHEQNVARSATTNPHAFRSLAKMVRGILRISDGRGIIARGGLCRVDFGASSRRGIRHPAEDKARRFYILRPLFTSAGR